MPNNKQVLLPPQINNKPPKKNQNLYNKVQSNHNNNLKYNLNQNNNNNLKLKMNFLLPQVMMFPVILGNFILISIILLYII